MARKITIPITDHGASGICSTGYIVEYRNSGAVNWTTAEFAATPIELSNLIDDVEYEIRVKRVCCDGLVSAPLELTVNTTLLNAPENFAATPGDGEVALDWDDVSSAESYTLERADDSGFTTNLTTAYTGSASSYTDTELVNDTTYYYRVKATATNHADGDYSTLNATPTAA